ncbi:MAG: ABC transporter ATP-binding protein [Proteobacteria bacterium]|nr:ABC transporter ATP-binding protein [Pseudomonadota bacterium]
MIEVNQLSKKYGNFTAVDNVSFSVEKGEILGFLGPNGAGKSTTMKMLSCFITPTSGTANIFGKDILENSLEVRQHIGYLPESAPSYQNMTVLEFLEFIASVRGFEGSEKANSIEKIIETTSLDSARFQTIDTLSKGYKQRVGFAQALIHDPPVLILDEPTDGLDPNQKKEVRTLIKKMSKEKAIILSTHILEEMEAVCTRAIIINQGRIVANGAPSDLLKESSMYNVLTLNLPQEPNNTLLEAIKQLEHVEGIETDSAFNDSFKVRVKPKEKKDILPEVKNLLNQQSIDFNEIYREKGYMDEVFWNLTLGGRS